MAINADKPHLWKADTRASVDQFNQWFLKFAPKAFREARKSTVDNVAKGLLATEDLTKVTTALLKTDPGILPMLRMSTCPPLARDRLIGLADSTKNLVGCLELGKLPPRIAPKLLEEHLGRIARTILALRDTDIFPWIGEKRKPTKEERYRSHTRERRHLDHPIGVRYPLRPETYLNNGEGLRSLRTQLEPRLTQISQND